MGTWADSDVDVRKGKEEEKISIRDYSIDQNYLQNVGLKLVAGKNFPPSAANDREQFVILNETALHIFKFGAPSEAIGQQLFLGDSTPVEIIGVVKDFNFRPLTYEIGPLVLRYRPSAFQYLNVKISESDISGTLSYIDDVWKKFDKTHPLNFQFFEEQVRESYREFRVTMIVLGFVGFLAITVACLGLLGMAIFTAESKIKEIGIRKVFGAGVGDIVLLLSRGFLLLIGLAILLALPISYVLGNAFLEQFAYRIDIGINTLGFGILLILILSLLTICSQTVRAALANPVKSLRNE
jgi:putative ABC transport system permease protein